MKYKITGILLLCGILLASVACSSEKPVTDNTVTTDTSAVQSEITEEVTTAELPDIPEDTDYSGHNFRVIARGSGKWTCTDMYAEEATGERLNDAVFERNQFVEENLNIEITMETVASDNNLYNTITQNILAGEDAFDLLWVDSNNIVKLAMNGHLVDINGIDTLDLTHSWWDEKAVENLCINDCIYFTTGDISIMDNYATYVIAFNKSLAEEYNIGNLYDEVRNGSWTADLLAKHSKAVSSDLDGNGEFDDKDLYGFMTYNADYMGFMLSCGSSIAKIDKKGISLNYNNERSLTMLNKIAEMHLEPSTYLFKNDEIASQIFVEGRTLFSFRSLVNINFYRDMETDYGILPTPKLREDDEEYHCGAHAYGLSLIAFPITSSDIDRTGNIVELMAYKSKEVLTPAFYDATLKGKYFRDEESGEMLDIIFHTRLYDLGYFGNWGSFKDKMQSMSSANSAAFASEFASIENSVQAALDETVEAFGMLG